MILKYREIVFYCLHKTKSSKLSNIFYHSQHELCIHFTLILTPCRWKKTLGDADVEMNYLAVSFMKDLFFLCSVELN